jgi:hypothetical protein
MKRDSKKGKEQKTTSLAETDWLGERGKWRNKTARE